MRRFIVAVGFVALWAVGCSSDDDAAPPVSSDRACTDLAAAICDKAQSCASAFVLQQWGDLATCNQRAKLECVANAGAPSTGSTPADIASCASALKTATCAALLDNDLPAACHPKPGGIADGAACGNDSQCASGFCGLDNDKEVCGSCATKPTEGGKCIRNHCPAGLVCSANGTCNKPVAANGACDDSKRCAAGSTCFGGTCKADVATEGAACNVTSGPICDARAGLFCLGKCVEVTLVAAGAECGIEGDATGVTAFKLCEKNGYCNGLNPDATPQVFKGTCVAAAKDGETCIEGAAYNKGPGCLEPAECIAGKCVLHEPAACK